MLLMQSNKSTSNETTNVKFLQNILREYKHETLRLSAPPGHCFFAESKDGEGHRR